MKSHWKFKIFSAILTLTMLFTLIPGTVFAGEYDTGEFDLSVGVVAPFQDVPVNGAIWQMFPGDNSSGTGNFNTYLSMQALGNKTSEQGYNSDRQTKEFDEKKSWTMALPLSAVPIVEWPEGSGHWYREFVVDVNETTGGNFISLDKFQIWQTDDAALSGYVEATNSFPPGAVKVYDIDTTYNGGGTTADRFLKLGNR
jgi:hypothetical protein